MAKAIKYVRAEDDFLNQPETDGWHWFHPWDLDPEGYDRVKHWCTAEFTRNSARWRCTGYGGNEGKRWGRIGFRDHRDAILFRLRWC